MRRLPITILEIELRVAGYELFHSSNRHLELVEQEGTYLRWETIVGKGTAIEVAFEGPARHGQRGAAALAILTNGATSRGFIAARWRLATAGVAIVAAFRAL